MISAFIGGVVIGLAWMVSYSMYWWYRFNWSDFGRKIAQIPGPYPFPLFGSILEAARHFKTPLELFQVKWVKKYGGIYKIILGNRVSIGISSPEYIQKVLKSQKLLAKGENYECLQDWLGTGLLLLHGNTEPKLRKAVHKLKDAGPKWHSRRRMLTPAFHFQILERYVPVFNEQSQILVDLLWKRLDDDHGGEVDVYPFITNCALDVIIKSAMGVSLEAQTRYSEYVRAVHSMSAMLTERFLKPWLFINTRFYVSPLATEYKRCVRTLHVSTSQVIAERKTILNEDEKLKEDHSNKNKILLDAMLLQCGKKDGDITDADILAEVNTFTLEGHDTITTAMCSFLHLMAQYPEEQEEVITEIFDIFGVSDRPCTSSDTARLKYLECCIKETLRLYPSIPMYERACTEEIDLGDYVIPVGCSLSIFAYAAHRNPDYFPEPDSFRPERFVPGNSAGRHPFSFVPFSAGPRNCIGQRFAMLELKIVLSTLLRNFKLELTPKSKLSTHQEITLKQKNGVFLKVTPRVHGPSQPN